MSEEDLGPECPCDLCNPWAGESDDDPPTPEPPADESSGEVLPPSTWPAWGQLTGDDFRHSIWNVDGGCMVMTRGEEPVFIPEPATDPHEMEAE